MDTVAHGATLACIAGIRTIALVALNKLSSTTTSWRLLAIGPFAWHIGMTRTWQDNPRRPHVGGHSTLRCDKIDLKKTTKVRAAISYILAMTFGAATLYPGPIEAIQYGINYNWHSVTIQPCPQIEDATALMPIYPQVRQTVQSQLHAMKSSGVTIVRAFVEWGDNVTGASNGSFVGELIMPPTTTVPPSYFDNVNLFAQDVHSAGIGKLILSMGGSGSYAPATCGNDQNNLVIPTYHDAISKLMSRVVNAPGQKPDIKIDLTNEISPSNYEPQCNIDARTNFIKSIWIHYVDNYGPSRASFSSIVDDSTDFHVAGNRLNNLIAAINSTGRPSPSWFEVHAYGSSTGVVNMLRGVYQTYSDFGYLSNSPTPKETIIGEIYYEVTPGAQGIDMYLNTIDGFNGGKINLSSVIAWPLTQPVGCAHAANVVPPYVASVYRNTISVLFQSGFDF